MDIQDDASPQLERLAEGLRSAALLHKIALAAERSVKSNTRQGLDADGRPFRRARTAKSGSPYSPGHARKRKAVGLPTNIVNLNFDTRTGMLSRIDHILASDLSSTTVLFTDAGKEQLARYAHDYGRVFFAVSDETQDRITEIVGEHVAGLLTLSGPAGA